MNLDYSKAMPVVIESEAVPKDCLLLISPPEHFVRPAGLDPAEEFFQFLMQCRPSVIKNIGKSNESA